MRSMAVTNMKKPTAVTRSNPETRPLGPLLTRAHPLQRSKMADHLQGDQVPTGSSCMASSRESLKKKKRWCGPDRRIIGSVALKRGPWILARMSSYKNKLNLWIAFYLPDLRCGHFFLNMSTRMSSTRDHSLESRLRVTNFGLIFQNGRMSIFPVLCPGTSAISLLLYQIYWWVWWLFCLVTCRT